MCLVFSTIAEFFNHKGDVMQLTKKNIYDRAVTTIAALIWVSGLLAAGSDSIYLPWLNAGGALVFLGASLWLGRILPRLEAEGSVVSSPQLARKPVERTVLGRSFGGKKGPGVNTRYAGGWSAV